MADLKSILHTIVGHLRFFNERQEVDLRADIDALTHEVKADVAKFEADADHEADPDADPGA